MTKPLSFLSSILLLIANVAYPQSVPAKGRPTSSSPKLDEHFGQIPLSFEPNRGQIDSSVKYLSRGQGYAIFLQPDAVTFALNKPAKTPRAGSTPVANAANGNAIKMNLVGADPKADMSPERPLQGYSNYMRGNDRSKWQLGIPTFAAIRIADVYPGIDLVYYGTQRQLEYDFVVAPGTDARTIRLTMEGAKPILTSQGELILQLGKKADSEDLHFKKPEIYQQLAGKRQPVDGAFTVTANGEVGFHVGEYDHSRELVIDPIISYGSYFGGSGEDEINGSVLNASNQLYAVGQTFSPTLPSGTGEFQPSRSGTKNSNYHDGFVTKFSADGSTVLWTTYLSGSQDDFATSVAVNASDEAYVVGYTNSCGADNSIPGVAPNTAVSFPFTGDAVQNLCSPSYNSAETAEANGGSYDAFLVKLSSDGRTELYGTPLGGSANDIAQSIVLDATGRPYIVGETSSTQYYKCSAVGPHCGDVPAYPVDNHGNPDIGISNYPTTSNAFYSSTAESQQYSTTDPNSGNTGGPQDEQAFITILSADLHSFVYSSLIGGGVIGGCGNGACNTNGIAVAVNAAGIGYIGGNTSSAHWPTTAGAFAATCSNAGAANSQCPMTGWLAAFDPTKSGSASLLFSTYINGSSAGLDGGGNPLYPAGDVYGVAVDSQGNVIATGDTNANDFPTTADTLQPACVQFGDGNGNSKRCASAYVTKLSPTGATVWSTYFGPPTQPGNFVVGNAIAVDASDNVYVVGTSTSPTLPLVNAITTNPAQNDDAFVIELSPTASTEVMGTFIGANGISVDNNALHLDSNLNAYFSGSIQYSTNGTQSFPATPGAFSTTGLGGSADGWVMKLITQQQTSTTALTVSPNPATPSQTVTLTATVTTSSTVVGTLLPTGTVTFYNGTTVIGTGNLNTSGVAVYSGTLAGGTYNVTASYAGDAGFNSSVSTATSLTVSSATPTTTTLTASPAALTYGQKATLTATVLAGSSPATSGTVTFTAGSTVLGTAAVNAQGVATLSITPPVGIYSIVASYAGTASVSNPTGYGSSTSSLTSSAPLTVTKATSTTTLSTSSASAGTGASITLTATVTTGATGTVTFFNGTTMLGTGTLGTGGTATVTTSFTAAGSFSLTAVYGGDANFTGSTSAALTQIVVVPTFTVAETPTSLTIVHGATGSTVITATPVGGFTGTVTFACGTLPASASCAFAPTTLAFTATSTVQTTTLTINTKAATTSSLRSLPGLPFAPQIVAAILLLPLGLTRRLLRAAHKGNSWTRSILLLTIVFLSAVGLVGMVGCSSGTTTNAATTPAGTYTVPVNVTSGATTMTLNLQLTVQ
jgi:hypothetical protein